MSDAKKIQLAFLQKIKATLPAHYALVDELADLLGTSNDSAYRRMRGETLLSIEEIFKICSHFKVPFETTTHPNSDDVTFTYRRLRDQPEGFSKWMEAMLGNVLRIAQVPNSSILYAANDIPIWHHFNNDELIAFKLFYWQKSILNVPQLEGKKFNPDLLNPDDIQKASEMLKAYNQINSTEIWTEDTVNSTLKQVEYFWESGFFNSQEEALRMCDHIQEELNLLKQKAEKNSKLIGKGESETENFTLYQSEVMIGNNSILATLGSQKIAYSSYNTFNMMATQNEGYITESESWIKNLTRKSILISGVNEKQRHRFFRILDEKIDDLRAKIK